MKRVNIPIVNEKPDNPALIREMLTDENYLTIAALNGERSGSDKKYPAITAPENRIIACGCEIG